MSNLYNRLMSNNSEEQTNKKEESRVGLSSKLGKRGTALAVIGISTIGVNFGISEGFADSSADDTSNKPLEIGDLYNPKVAKHSAGFANDYIVRCQTNHLQRAGGGVQLGFVPFVYSTKVRTHIGAKTAKVRVGLADVQSVNSFDGFEQSCSNTNNVKAEVSGVSKLRKGTSSSFRYSKIKPNIVKLHKPGWNGKGTEALYGAKYLEWRNLTIKLPYKVTTEKLAARSLCVRFRTISEPNPVHVKTLEEVQAMKYDPDPSTWTDHPVAKSKSYYQCLSNKNLSR